MAGGRRTILILEDEQEQARILQKHLQYEGYEVQLFHESSDALAAVETDLPDLILLDIMLGSSDEGYEVCRRLKQDQHTQDIPVIMLTARIEIADKVRGLEIGADDYMVKPVQLDELTARVHAALRVKARHEDLLHLSMMDELTGLYNRRHFDTRLRMEVESVRRYQNLLSCLMLDVDHFKNFNDTYGHPVGDQVLREIAVILNQRTRVVDLVARYGGEEFVILLPQTGANGAYVLAERIRRSVEAHSFCKPQKLAVTISIGCASFTQDTMSTADQVIKTADDALYKAKRTRNCVVANP